MNGQELQEYERQLRATEWKPNLASYISQRTTAEQEYHDKRTKINLLAEARQAASWGVPDRESIGYSQSDLCSIIYKLIAYIETH